jgi:hypothetical protein
MSTHTGYVPQVIDGPPYRASANGLLATARVVDDANLRWAAGGTFRSMAAAGNDAGQVVVDGCAPWAKTATMGEPYLLGVPIVLYGWWQCSPVGYTPADVQAQAHAGFLDGESFRLEALLWAWLVGTPTPATTPLLALGQAEAAIANPYAGEGLIHAGRLAATQLAQYLTRSGQNLRTTACNTPVVVGDGYPNTATVVIGTGPITVIRGPVVDLTDPGSGLNRSINDLSAVVERSYLILVDTPQHASFSSP